MAVDLIMALAIWLVATPGFIFGSCQAVNATMSQKWTLSQTANKASGVCVFVRQPDSSILKTAIFINMVLEPIAAPVLVRNL